MGQSQAWGGRVRYGGKPTTGGSECQGSGGNSENKQGDCFKSDHNPHQPSEDFSDYIRNKMHKDEHLGASMEKEQLCTRLLSETHQAEAPREQRAPLAVGALCASCAPLGTALNTETL